MDTLRIQIHNIKNINEAQLELPFDNGIYTFVGTNGCGKSTMMLCLAQLLSNQLNRLTISDTKMIHLLDLKQMESVVCGNEAIISIGNILKIHSDIMVYMKGAYFMVHDSKIQPI